MLYTILATLIVVAIAFVVVPMERAAHRRKMELLRRKIEQRERVLAEREAAGAEGDRARRPSK